MKKQSNEQKIIHSVMTLLASGETRITRYGIAKHSGVEISGVYQIVKRLRDGLK